VVAASGVRGASQPEIMVFYFQIIFWYKILKK
jgi:hypothetical protein